MTTSRVPYRLALVTAALAVARFSTAPATIAKPEASIPFGLIRNWQADHHRGMWIRRRAASGTTRSFSAAASA
ncbi:MAG TPA: hypothetical protein VFS52_21510 [Steroidobacteraceae bacterium]|jgi:hypothetical protein|nr:hypothetical protein [Steroidobacteraceae bacterium]